MAAGPRSANTQLENNMDGLVESTIEASCSNSSSGSCSADSSPLMYRRRTPHPRTRVADRSSDDDDDDDDDIKGELLAQPLPPIFTSDRAYSCDERVALFCDEIIGKCSAAEMSEALGLYLTGKLSRAGGPWAAVWKTPPGGLLDDPGDLQFVGVLVEVTWRPGNLKTYPQQVCISVTEPFSSNITHLPRRLLAALMAELSNKVTVLDVYPVQGQGQEVDNIAEALEQLRVFNDSLWKDLVDEQQCEEYARRIEKRLRLYYDMQGGAVPGVMAQRYKQTLAEYNRKQAELNRYQASLPWGLKPHEAVECWRKYYEMAMLAGFLKFWEDTRLNSKLPSIIYKRRRGQRTSGKPATHIVAQMLTVDMVKSLPSDALIQQHDSLSGALNACFSGDTVVLFPGEYRALGPSTLTDDITIRGAGERQEVVLTSDPGGHHSLVVSKAARVKLSNLRLQQEGPGGAGGAAVVVEAGELTLDGCELRGGASGVSVHTGATLLMRNCEVSEAQGAAVELSPGSVAELSGNEIHHCGNKYKHGAVSLKVLPKPCLTMSDNHIHDNQGYGLAIVVPDNLQPPVPKREPADRLAGGDQSGPDHWVLQDLGLELQSNKLDQNRLGDVQLLHHSWFST
ncbi:unnamed protein product [Merluccius merluccius]